jgi:hypothetical protein
MCGTVCRKGSFSGAPRGQKIPDRSGTVALNCLTFVEFHLAPREGILGKRGGQQIRRRRALLREQIVKMDCERCKLRTEHYVVDYGDRPGLIRCLGCGHVTTSSGLGYASHWSYLLDDRKPVYVT